MEGRSKALAALDFFKMGRPVTLDDCFRFMIDHGFFTREQLHDALVYSHDGTPKPRNMRVVNIVAEFKSAAD
jgi:hypothetical protein